MNEIVGQKAGEGAPAAVLATELRLDFGVVGADAGPSYAEKIDKISSKPTLESVLVGLVRQETRIANEIIAVEARIADLEIEAESKGAREGMPVAAVTKTDPRMVPGKVGADAGPSFADGILHITSISSLYGILEWLDEQKARTANGIIVVKTRIAKISSAVFYRDSVDKLVDQIDAKIVNLERLRGGPTNKISKITAEAIQALETEIAEAVNELASWVLGAIEAGVRYDSKSEL